MKLTLVITTLMSGGAERAMANMANHWAAQGWSVTLLTFDNGTEPPFYTLHPDVQHYPLRTYWGSPDPVRAVWNTCKRLLVLRHAIAMSHPQAVISMLEKPNILTIIATRGLQVPVVVMEQNDPASKHSIGRLWEILRHALYHLVDRVVVLSEAYKTYFLTGVQQRCRVIPNPVTSLPEALPPARSLTADGAREIIAMGRLAPQKGFDMLLQAFAQVAPTHPDWSLTIWGEGEERANLEQLRDSLGLGARVHLPGLTKEPFVQFRQSDLFVLSSRFEGFPNVLCEAMACGLPVISFDCVAGIRDIIRDGVDGVLVPPEDIDALTRTMARLMGNAAERERLAARAPVVVARFGLQQVMALWEDVLAEVARPG